MLIKLFIICLSFYHVYSRCVTFKHQPYESMVFLKCDDEDFGYEIKFLVDKSPVLYMKWIVLNNPTKDIHGAYYDGYCHIPVSNIVNVTDNDITNMTPTNFYLGDEYVVQTKATEYYNVDSYYIIILFQQRYKSYYNMSTSYYIPIGGVRSYLSYEKHVAEEITQDYMNKGIIFLMLLAPNFTSDPIIKKNNDVDINYSTFMESLYNNNQQTNQTRVHWIGNYPNETNYNISDLILYNYTHIDNIMNNIKPSDVVVFALTLSFANNTEIQKPATIDNYYNVYANFADRKVALVLVWGGNNYTHNNSENNHKVVYLENSLMDEAYAMILIHSYTLFNKFKYLRGVDINKMLDSLQNTRDLMKFKQYIDENYTIL